MVNGYPFPHSVARHVGKCNNFGLFFDRFLKYPLHHWEWKVQGTDHKPRVWNDLQSNIKRSLRATQDDHCAVMKRRDRYFQVTEYAAAMNATLRTRLTIGLGGTNVMENGITLHRIFGFPIIPGSAVKGACAHARFCEIAEALQLPPLEAHVLNALVNEDEHYKSPWAKLDELLTKEIDWNASGPDPSSNPVTCYRSLINPEVEAYRKDNHLPEATEVEMTELFVAHHREYQALFGSPSRQGSVIFGDAYPTRLMLDGNRPILEIDLVNPHYRGYYGSTGSKIQAPSDDDRPSISNFLAVAAGTPFQFFIESSAGDLREKAKKLLATAISESGIGAKTYANYGCFDPPT